MNQELEITYRNKFDNAHRCEFGKNRFYVDISGEVDEEFLAKLLEFIKQNSPEVIPHI